MEKTGKTDIEGCWSFLVKVDNVLVKRIMKSAKMDDINNS